MIAVTGATGQLGGRVIAELLGRKIKSHEIVAFVRNPAKAEGLKKLGVTLREANYDSPDSLEKALARVQKVILISSNEIGKRTQQHENVIRAAKKVGVQRIAYTSLLRADQSQMMLAQEHFATEKILRSSGLSFTILRNSWYIENYTDHVEMALQNGVAGAAGDGKISAASRADYAAAAVAALLMEKPKDVYELAGNAFTLTEYAKELSQQSGKAVAYHDMPQSAYAELLKKVGLPTVLADMLADSDSGIKRGELFSKSEDLKNLIGRPPMTLSQVIKESLAK